jgi:hypothetical protein
MFRKTVFASLIALGNAVATASGAAQAADQGPLLVNRNGSQEVVYDQGRRANVVGGAFATITGGGENTNYQTAPAGARFEEPRLIGRLSGGGEDETITYTLPAQVGARG